MKKWEYLSLRKFKCFVKNDGASFNISGAFSAAE